MMSIAKGAWRAMALGVALAASVASACPSGLRPTDEQYRQRRTLPVLQGLGHDIPGQRVFISACRRRAYACDLLQVELNRPSSQVAAYFRGSSGRHGYVWPAVSPDGRHLAAVRTLRHQRPSQRDVSHDLVEIDLQTGEERVLASAGEGRFDRLLYADNRTVMAVRSFRSGPSVRCSPGSCTDWAEVWLVRNGSTTVLPIELASFHISILPLGAAGPFWVGGPTRDVEFLAGGIRTARGRRWVVEPQGGVSEGVDRVPAMIRLLNDVERQQGSLGGWTQDFIVSPHVGLGEGQPFCGSRAQMATLDQTTLANSRSGLFVAKMRNGGQVTLLIGQVENRGAIPWVLVSESAAFYPTR